jgi:hypothetical protein
MPFLPLTCQSAWQYQAEVHPQLTEKKSLVEAGLTETRAGWAERSLRAVGTQRFINHNGVDR